MNPAIPSDQPGHGRGFLPSRTAQHVDGIVVLDADLHITEFADGAEQLYGWPRAEVLGKHWLTFIPTAVTEPSADDLSLRLREGREVRIEARVRRRDGTRVVLQVTVTPLRDAQGQLTGWIGVGRELSEADAAAVRERELLGHLHRALAGSKTALLDVDLTTGTVYRSPTLAKMLGVEPGEILPDLQGLKPFGHPDDWQRHTEAVAALLTGTAEEIEFEGRLRHRAGNWVWVQGRYAVVERNPAGAPTRVAGTIVDITPEKDAREAARVAQDRLANVIEGSGAGYFDYDMVTGHAYRSPQIARMLGCQPSDIPPTIDALERRLHPDDWTRRQRERADLMANRDRRWSEGHYRFRHHDGHWVWLAARANVLGWDDAGQPTRVAGILADITTQKALELAVREREGRLRAFFDSPGVGIIIATPDGVMVEANDRACAILGYTQEDLATLSWQDVTFPDDLDADVDEYKRMVAGQIDHYSMDKRYRRKDGRVVWCLLSVSCVREPDGRITHAVGIIKDITSRKEAEQALLSRERELQAIFDTPSLGIAFVDNDNRWARANQQARDMLGYTADELAHRTWLDVTHPDDRDLHAASLQRILAGTSDQFAVDKRYIRKDGSVLWAMTSVSAVRDADGQLLRRIVFITDIGRRKEAEQHLRESEETFRTIVEEASEAIHLFDLRSGHIALMNARYIEQTGFSENELREMSLAEARERIHPDDRDQVVSYLQRLLADSQHRPKPLEYRWRTKPDEYVWVSDTRAVVRNDAGQPIALVGVSHDITERKRTDEAIRTALAENVGLISTLRKRLASANPNDLAAILPICMYCRKIRDEGNRWATIERYIQDHTSSLFSHGMCPDCAERVLSELERE